MMSWRTNHVSLVADALRALRTGTWRVDEIEQFAQIIADAEGHSDLEAVIRRELTC